MHGVGRFSFKKKNGNDEEKVLSDEEQRAKVQEMKKIIGPLADKLPKLCDDASLVRYLKARNWSTKKAARMLKDTIKWRLEFKPEKIRWDDIAPEAETGKIYKASYLDKKGRIVLVMRPGFQNTNSIKGQIRYLVYCMESAIASLPPDQDQMVWLIDFQGWNMSSVSVSVTRETIHILQDHYPERLGLGILYNPPKIFESFWKMIRPFIEAKTFKKVRFVYSDDPLSQQTMEDLFDVDKLECAFMGRNLKGFNYDEYARVMVEDERKRDEFISHDVLSPADLGFETESTATDLSVSECEKYEVSDDIGSPFCEEATLAHLKLQNPSEEKLNQAVDHTKDPALGASKGFEEVRT
ncbi:hypothetical protein MLD38_015895 [Melastoma candidum]|uniref:Uncharacterized protein n=1 Tax=Melastoma candidum TaxID=119954 RepID=A0ACB9RHT5_9MYRT|nr:hypothetical protein MLD38_015895 [Melastoma candidum]